MKTNKELQELINDEQLLKIIIEDDSQEMSILTERLDFLTKKQASDTKKLNGLQVDIEDFKANIY